MYVYRCLSFGKKFCHVVVTLFSTYEVECPLLVAFASFKHLRNLNEVDSIKTTDHGCSIENMTQTS